MKILKAKPLLNHVITTADRYESTELKDGLLSTKEAEGDIKFEQRIIAIGPNCFDGLNVGDLVLVNPMNYLRPEHSLRENSILEKSRDEVNMVISWPLVEINDRECLFLYDRDLDMVIEEWADDEGNNTYGTKTVKNEESAPKKVSGKKVKQLLN